MPQCASMQQMAIRFDKYKPIGTRYNFPLLASRLELSLHKIERAEMRLANDGILLPENGNRHLYSPKMMIATQRERERGKSKKKPVNECVIIEYVQPLNYGMLDSTVILLLPCFIDERPVSRFVRL